MFDVRCTFTDRFKHLIACPQLLLTISNIVKSYGMQFATIPSSSAAAAAAVIMIAISVAMHWNLFKMVINYHTPTT